MRRLAWLLACCALAVGGAVTALAVARGPAISTASILVSPEPGAVAASPRTEISLRGAPPATLGPIEVTGSRSGTHTGHLVDHSDGKGASFVPDAPFTAGEQVTVRTQLRVRGAQDGDFRFTVGRGRLESRAGGTTTAPPGTFNQQRFHSRPDLAPPKVSLRTRRAGHTRGEIFLATKQGKRDGPLILDDHGDLVWFHPQRRGRPASDLRAARWNGQPALTFWEGRFVVGWGYGEGVVLDQSYREVARVRAGNGFQADLHEFQLLPGGVGLLAIYHGVRRGGRTVMDNIIQEIDVATGAVLYEWHALDHVATTESYRPRDKGMPWDYFHLNSIQRLSDGDFLISARNTHAVYRVDRQTGSIVWRLGGKRSDFRMGRGTRFAWQHDARLHGDGTLTLFDNGAEPAIRSRSRGLRLRLSGRRAKLVRANYHPRRLSSPNQGGVQYLGSGRMFVGWGANSYFTEFSRRGRVLFDAHLAKGYDSYRAYRVDWTGRPLSTPAVAAKRAAGGRVTVWASWNGATEVARWQVLAGGSSDALSAGRTYARRGFETAMTAPRGSDWVAVRALAADGSVLGTSEPEQVR